jgi:hypothetical protein
MNWQVGTLSTALLIAIVGLLLCGCDGTVNARDPEAAGPKQIRPAMMQLCLKHPEAVGCERFTKGLGR